MQNTPIWLDSNTREAAKVHSPVALAAKMEDPIFVPFLTTVANSQLTSFIRWCEQQTGRHFADYAAFDAFAVTEWRTFWHLFLEWSKLLVEGEAEPVCAGEAIETARFFPHLRLNYAECLLSGSDAAPAITARHADGHTERLTRRELRERVARLATVLVRLGVEPGEHVVAVARNNVNAVVAALATVAVGGVFASCGPDMGAFAIQTRFAPLAPRVLFGCMRSLPWDRGESLAERVDEIAAGLPSLSAVISLDDDLPGTGRRSLDALLAQAPEEAATWPRLPFNHPLFVLFSSGTTGAPKCIVHGAGGTLLEHVKELRLHSDMRPGDRLFFQTSCGWMMWNWQLSALAAGVELVLYDGPLDAPETFWRIVAEERVTLFGTNPAYLHHSERVGLEPGRSFDLTALRGVFSTGAVLPARRFHWLREAVKPVPLQSISGGTDIIGCFVLGNPNLPVHAGESQCRSLGLDVRALPRPEAQGDPVGELVCANPFPSRPLGFVGDADGARFHNSYFAANPGLWTHGDLIESTPNGGWRIHGRSDGTLNVRGIRVGPGEIARILADDPDLTEVMAVEQYDEEVTGGSRMVLLLVMADGVVLTRAVERRIKTELARRGGPALVPDVVVDVPALPVTYNGKRSEVAARAAVNLRAAPNRDALLNPECLDAIAARAVRRPASDTPEVIAAHDGEEEHAAALRAICARVLGTESLDPDDNITELGADSLTLLTLCLEIERRFEVKIPLAALLAAPTLTGLARIVAGGGAEPPAALRHRRRVPTEIRPFDPGDRASVCRMLAHGFGGQVGRTSWERLLDCPWGEGRPRGLVLTAGDEIVGFIGTIHAHRDIGGKSGVVCNLSSWYVRPEFRGQSLELLLAATSDPEVTYTTFTPGNTACAALKALGFQHLDRARLFLPPLAHLATLRAPPVRLSFDPEALRRRLDPDRQQLFDDHAIPDCLGFVAGDAGGETLIVVKRRLVRLARRFIVAYSDVLHCSQPSVLKTHLERIKWAVLRRQRTVALCVDERLWAASPPLGVVRASEMLFRSSTFAAAEIDQLYSERALLSA